MIQIFMNQGQRGRDLFKKYKGVINAISTVYRLFPIEMRKNALERHRNMRGKLGIAIRYAILKSLSGNIGDNVAIFPSVYLFNPENMMIGNNVSIHPMTYIECGPGGGGVKIGNDVSIAHGVTIMATSHRFDALDENIKDQGIIQESVNIENNVWIGARAVILSGITIREGSIIGAGAVVTKSTDENGIYAGVPAKRIKGR